jgi:signal transduction histidine kinase
MNILSNAIEALEEFHSKQISQGNTDYRGQITVRTSLIDSQWIQIEIADNGSGIPEEVQPKIFDPFFTTKPAGKGTGMGMSISYQIITEKHYGKLNCFSTLGEGSEFTIKIPIYCNLSE